MAYSASVSLMSTVGIQSGTAIASCPFPLRDPPSGREMTRLSRSAICSNSRKGSHFITAMVHLLFGYWAFDNALTNLEVISSGEKSSLGRCEHWRKVTTIQTVSETVASS